MALLLLSGGMDSVTLLHEYSYFIKHSLYIDYGNNNSEREKEILKLHLTDDKYTIIQAPDIYSFNKQCGLINPTNQSYELPFRNAFLLSIAVSYAKLNNIKDVYIAICQNVKARNELTSQDANIEFLKEFQLCAKNTEGVKIKAPYKNLNKFEVYQKYKSFNLDLQVHSHSCYQNEICNKCPACMQLKEVDKLYRRKLKHG